jgi:hypothetical protein
MTIRPDLIEKLRAKRAKLTENVSPEKLEALHAKGLLSARERLETLFDEGTFQELGLYAAHAATAFGMAGRVLPADGVIAGNGYVGPGQVAAFSQDFNVVAGTLGKMQATQDHAHHAPRPEDRRATGRLQGLRRRTHSGGGRRPLRLRRRLLRQCPALGRRTADRRDLRSLCGWCSVLAGTDGLRHHDAQQRAHVPHRTGSDQGGDRPCDDDGRGRRRRDAFDGERQRALRC